MELATIVNENENETVRLTVGELKALKKWKKERMEEELPCSGGRDKGLNGPM